jgi:hypothetical protein
VGRTYPPRACRAWWLVSFSNFPCSRVGGGVAGWKTRPEGPASRCGVWGFGTLLGPEETSAGWWGFLGWPSLGSGHLTRSWLFVGVWWWLWWVGVWWCVECCIVDASILLCLDLWFYSFVVKCCRAQGGCLGIRSR